MADGSISLGFRLVGTVCDARTANSSKTGKPFGIVKVFTGDDTVQVMADAKDIPVYDSLRGQVGAFDERLRVSVRSREGYPAELGLGIINDSPAPKQ